MGDIEFAIYDGTEVYQDLEKAIRSLVHSESLRVLDVGCGDRLRVRFPVPIYLVGIDTSPEQLERNQIAQEKILGDIERYPLDAEAFDVVVCWEVLEHIHHPKLALSNCARALKHGGILIIAVPNPASIKGIITKWSPHWFHIWAYRYLLGNPNAGRPGYPPFPTTMRWCLTPRRLVRLCRQLSLEPYFFALMRSQQALRMAQKHRIAGVFYWGTIRLLRFLSLGKYDGSLTDIRAVFVKR